GTITGSSASTTSDTASDNFTDQATIGDGYSIHVSGSGDNYTSVIDDNETVHFGDTDNGSETGSGVGSNFQARVEGSNSSSTGGKGSDTSNVKIDGDIKAEEH